LQAFKKLIQLYTGRYIFIIFVLSIEENGSGLNGYEGNDETPALSEAVKG